MFKIQTVASLRVIIVRLGVFGQKDPHPASSQKPAPVETHKPTKRFPPETHIYKSPLKTLDKADT